MNGFETSDKDLSMKAASNFGWVSTFEKQFNGFLQVSGRGFDAISLTDHVKFRTKGDIPGPFLFDDRSVTCRRHGVEQWLLWLLS